MFFLLLIFLTAPAFGENAGCSIDVADEIAVGLNEYVCLPFVRHFDGSRLSAVCDDPDVLEDSYEIIRQNDGTVCSGELRIRMQKKGTWTVHFLYGEEEIRETAVKVDDMVSSARTSQERYVLRAGETVSLGLTFGDGAMYGPPSFRQDPYEPDFLSFSEDGSGVTALSTGRG